MFKSFVIISSSRTRGLTFRWMTLSKCLSEKGSGPDWACYSLLCSCSSTLTKILADCDVFLFYSLSITWKILAKCSDIISPQSTGYNFNFNGWCYCAVDWICPVSFLSFDWLRSVKSHWYSCNNITKLFQSSVHSPLPIIQCAYKNRLSL